MQYITEAEIDRIASETGKTLAKEKKVRITIPAEHGEKFWEGGINGHFFRIRTETPVEIPKSLALLIAGSRKVLTESEIKLCAFAASGGKRVG